MRRVFVLLLVLGSFVTIAAPQQKKDVAKPYALIFGTVYGPDDHPISGIRVKIRRAADKKPKWELRSDHHGEFAQRLPAGQADYVVWAQLKSRQASENTKVKVHF